jgi:glycosyltransferase involved in cell wall biosynthesis
VTKVSVIIPTYRDDEGLGRTLSALAAQTYPAGDMEVIVVDNTPDFELEGRLQAGPDVHLLHEPRPGSYAARNRGLAEARGSVLCFTDADCMPAPAWIERGLAALEAGGGDALIAGHIEVFPQDTRHPTPVEVLELLTAFPQRTYADVHHFGATANVFTTRNVIERAGAFNDRTRSGGDREFGQRVHAAGFPVLFAEDVKVFHPARRRIGAFLAKRRRTIRGVLDIEQEGGLAGGRFLKGLLSDMRPPLATTYFLFQRKDLGPSLRRLRAVWVLWYARYYSAFYRMTLLLGHMAGRPRRL